MEIEIEMAEAGFHRGRSTHDHLFNIRYIIPKYREFYRQLFAYVGSVQQRQLSKVGFGIS